MACKGVISASRLDARASRCGRTCTADQSRPGVPETPRSVSEMRSGIPQSSIPAESRIPKRWKRDRCDCGPLQRLGDCALCALGIISDKVTERGGPPEHYRGVCAASHTLPGCPEATAEPRRTRLRAGITQGGMGDEATPHHWVAGCPGSVAGGGARRHRRGGPGAREGSHPG